MTKDEILDRVALAAKEAQIRDDVCSRSVLIGLKTYFNWIPDELIRASMSLCGGAGASSGSCGAYTCGLLAIGLRYNVPLDEELANPEKQGIGAEKFMELRDRFIKAMGSTLCPELQKQVFGRAYIFTDPADEEEYFKITDHNVKCAEVVEKATRVVAEMLLEDENSSS
ncbi:MAG: C_GCAxxG_C_C family protein [Clostridiales bacterium]|nr:C_GCAxxG_C_C family protein [Clostridiales bacterium]